jgi:hypothetical protein
MSETPTSTLIAIPASKLRPRDHSPVAITTLRFGAYVRVELLQPRMSDGVDACIGTVLAVDATAVKIEVAEACVVHVMRLYRRAIRHEERRDAEGTFVSPWSCIAAIEVGDTGPSGGCPEDAIGLIGVRAIAGRERVCA